MYVYIYKCVVFNNNFVFCRIFVFSFKFFGIVFVSSTNSSQVITESSIILGKYLPLLQLQVAKFQI